MNTPNDNWTFNQLTADANKRKATQPQPQQGERTIANLDHVRALVLELEQTQQQRDELLAAAKDVSQWIWNTGTHQVWQDRLNTAIANATK